MFRNAAPAAREVAHRRQGAGQEGQACNASEASGQPLLRLHSGLGAGTADLAADEPED
jgi:hypothetical protein